LSPRNAMCFALAWKRPHQAEFAAGSWGSHFRYLRLRAPRRSSRDRRPRERSQGPPLRPCNQAVHYARLFRPSVLWPSAIPRRPSPISETLPTGMGMLRCPCAMGPVGRPVLCPGHPPGGGGRRPVGGHIDQQPPSHLRPPVTTHDHRDPRRSGTRVTRTGSVNTFIHPRSRLMRSPPSKYVDCPDPIDHKFNVELGDPYGLRPFWPPVLPANGSRLPVETPVERQKFTGRVHVNSSRWLTAGDLRRLGDLNHCRPKTQVRCRAGESGIPRFTTVFVPPGFRPNRGTQEIRFPRGKFGLPTAILE